MTKSEWLKEFGASLSYIICTSNITQRELARKTGLTESTISKYISGKQYPSALAIVNLAYALNCTTDELIEFGDDISDL